MTEWRRVLLGEVATLNRKALGKSWPFSHLRYIDISSVGEGFLEESPTYFELAGAPSRAKRLLSSGDTVLSTVRPNRRSMFYAKDPGADWVVSTGFCTVTANSDVVDPKFLYYCLFTRKFTDYLVAHEKGAAYPAVTADDIANAPILLPPLEQQRAIAATLGALDDKIESNRRAVATISNLLDAISESNGADLPNVPLGDIATSIKDSVNPLKLGDAPVDHFSLPAFDSGARPERVGAASIKSNKLRVPKNAILISRLNPRFNRTWWASAEAETSALASTEFLVLASEDDLELAGVWLAARDPFFREELPKRVTGTSGSHQRVRPGDVLTIEVPDFRSAAPEVKHSALALLMRAESLRMESDRLTALRDALLPELLSGRLRVPAEGVAA